MSKPFEVTMTSDLTSWTRNYSFPTFQKEREKGKEMIVMEVIMNENNREELYIKDQHGVLHKGILITDN